MNLISTCACRLGYQTGEESDFRAVRSDYKPYVHQQLAYDRLLGEDGRSTIIATGTGSGKTECFLYPILEYCYAHRGEAGIKPDHLSHECVSIRSGQTHGRIDL